MRAVVSLVLLTTVAVGFQPTAPADRFFDSQGVRIRYVERGQGPPVVLIHGYTGDVERHWVAPGVLADLSKEYRVVALDCRGHGKSDKPVDPNAYGAAMAADIVRLLDHLAIRRAHLVGYSMGAMIVGHLLATHADRVLSATFVASHPVRTWTAADEEDAEAWARDLESDTPFRKLILEVSPPGAPPREEDINKLSQRLVAANDVSALAAYHRGRSTLAVTDAQLAAVRVPALGIIGTEDPSVQGMRDVKAVMPALTLVVVGGATHGGERGIMRQPAFLELLRRFLAGVR
jgi:pimeloyl-ACP methyl ester carboxylesterase